MRKSRARNYRKGVPVMTTFRVIDRRLLLEHPDVRNTIRRELAKAPQFGVDIESVQIRGNHVHLILRQDRDGSHRPGTYVKPGESRGISLFMQTALSQIARAGNLAAPRPDGGRFIERTYRAYNLENLEEYLRALAYLEGQDEHHGPYENERDSGPYKSEPTLIPDTVDGLVTAVPDLPFLHDLMAQLDPDAAAQDHPDDPWHGERDEDANKSRALSRAVGQVIDRAIENERLGRQKQAEQQAHREAAAKAKAQRKPVPPTPEQLALEDEIRARRPWQEAIEHLAAKFMHHGVNLSELYTTDYLPTPIQTRRPHLAAQDNQLRAHHLAFRTNLRHKHSPSPAPREGQTIHYTPAPPTPHPKPPPD